ncbi:MAG TPA: hypothetical protein VGR22_07530 [Thermomicrobiales bacterium]|nr:hypothetical protein [Thermomicrobiales bacterium]
MRDKGGDGNLLANARALLIGVLVSIGVILTVAAVVAVLVWASMAVGVLGMGRQWTAAVIGVVAVVGLVGSFAVGSWTGIRRTSRAGSLVIGGLVPLLVIVVTGLAVWPLIASMVDVRSAAIELGWIAAPDAGVVIDQDLPTQAELQQGWEEPGGSGPLSDPVWHLVAAIAFLGALLVAVILAGMLGAALNRRRRDSAGPRMMSRDRASPSLVILGAGIALLTVVLWSSLWTTGAAFVDIDQSAGPDVGVNLREVANHPEAMWGQSVTVSAAIDRLVGRHAAIIGSDTPLIGSKVLIVSEPELQEQVLAASSQGAELSEGDVVQVTGTVQRYDRESLAAELGVRLDEDADSGYDGSAVLLVSSINLDVPVAVEGGDKEFVGGSDGYDRGVTINDIVAAPVDHVGMTVTVSAEVEGDTLASHVFTIGDGFFLVVSAKPHPEVFREATAYVTGEVGIFDLARVEEQIGVDLDDEALSEYEGEPFILAEAIQVVA